MILASHAPLSAQSPAATGQGSAATDGQELARQAIDIVDRQRSISAQMRHRITMFGQQLVGTGLYQQLGQGEQRMLRLDMKVNVAEQTTSMQQVCDGRFLWVRRDLAAGSSVGRVDLRRVRDAVAGSSAATGSMNAAAEWMLLGGLPQLIGRLERNFQFAPPRDGVLENTPVIVLEGQWKPQQLALLLPQHKDKLAAGRQVNLALLPPQLPAHVRLVLRRDDHFPVRIDYLRVGEAAEPDAPPPLEPIMTMELYDVRLGKEIDPFVFDYKPGNLEVADHTEVYLGSLGLK